MVKEELIVTGTPSEVSEVRELVAKMRAIAKAEAEKAKKHEPARHLVWQVPKGATVSFRGWYYYDGE